MLLLLQMQQISDQENQEERKGSSLMSADVELAAAI